MRVMAGEERLEPEIYRNKFNRNKLKPWSGRTKKLGGS